VIESLIVTAAIVFVAGIALGSFCRGTEWLIAGIAS
jgi:hypothetical protein